MTTLMLTNSERSVLGDVPGAEQCFQLGMMYATGHSVPADMVSAHKWFNIAALMGSPDAKRLRHEIAAELSDVQVATAQRAARAWLTRH
jgi:TPR repeat protein